MECIIIDDEIASRESIKIMGDWKRLNISHVYTASNGKEALQIIQKHHPSLIISDMKMDGGDGSYLLESLKNIGYEACVVIISGYTDFTYMHSAIMYPVNEYLVKPIGPVNLNAGLQNALKKYEQRHLQDEDYVNRFQQISQTAFPEHIDITKLSENKNVIHFLSQIKSCYIILLLMLNKEEVCGSLFNHNQELMLFSLQNDIRKRYDREGHILLLQINMPGGSIAILKETDPGETVDHTVNELNAGLFSQFRKTYGLQYILLFGNPCRNMDELKSSMADMEEAIYHRNVFDTHNCIYVQHARSAGLEEPDSPGYFISRENQISEYLLLFQLDELQNLINRFFLLCREKEYCTLSLLYAEYTSLINLYARYLPAKTFSKWLSNCYTNLDSIGLYQNDFEHIESLFTETFCINMKALSDKDNEFNALFPRILSFVHQHYNEKLTLATLGKHFYVSREYISRLFKKHTEQTFINYLTNYRIMMAKQLLLSTDYSISAISEICGFKDQTYFFKVFRHKERMTPGQYRVIHMKNNESD